MRLWTYVGVLVLLTLPIALAALTILVLAFYEAGEKGELQLPAWGVLPFMAAVLFPMGYQLMLRFRKTKFMVPVPDMDNIDRTRVSRKVFRIFLSFLVGGVGVYGYFVYHYHANFKGEGHIAVFLIPAACLFFSTLPWFRAYRWLRGVEEGMISKYGQDTDEEEAS